MSKKTKIILTVILLVGVAGAISYFLLLPRSNPNQAVTSSGIDTLFGWKFPPGATKFPSTGSIAGGDLAYSSIRDPGGIPQGLPVRLQIPVIGVDSAIEDALITPDGKMDVPANSVNVAWFALGPHPGQVGSAVIGGHYGISNGVKFVFYDLDKVKVGDKAYIVNDEGQTLTFQVRSIKLFDRDADATTVFTSTDGLAHLNIITCEGIWNQVNGLYSQRRVLFTDLVPGTSPAPESSTPANVTFYRSLDVGSQGSDVTALQNVLEKKGFLTLPSGVAPGFYGALTSSAVAKYQVSVGLSSVGTFGPLTRAKLIAESPQNPVLPNTGEEVAVTVATTTQNTSPISTPALVQFVESLYATKMDGLITSILLIAVIFVVFKLIWL